MSIEERRPRFAGIFIQPRAIRTYPQGETDAHIVGYIGKVTRDEYDRFDHSIFFPDSWIGRSGIEKAYDVVLRGEDGGRQLEVNARGIPIKMLGEKRAQTGSDVRVSIDSKFDTSVRALLAGRQGVVLMMSTENGELLSAVSTPGFDPSVFVESNKSTERLALIGSKEHPLLNRGFNGLYPPGSVFKLVTAMAGLESGVITPYTSFHCKGYFKFSPKSRPFKCWFSEGHGRVDLYRALERSCNVYFYNVGRLVGEKRISEYAHKLGFGEPISFELPAESGLVPSSEWKRKIYRDAWYPGDTVTFAIGQGYLLVSPLQILRLVSAIATDGEMFEPKLVIDDSKSARPHERLAVRKETFKALKQGMLQVVQSDRGTGQLAKVNFERFAAKTGTAQAPPGKSHAWFAGFFPYDNPKIAFVIFVERGGSGGLVCARIAKQLVHLWSNLNVTPVP
jgi:penicillin-binding protein 2